jgi:hypothetical protein
VLDLGETRVTSRGLGSLKELTLLQRVSLGDTGAPEARDRAPQLAVPEVRVLR